jgi:hypothetical protein
LQLLALGIKGKKRPPPDRAGWNAAADSAGGEQGGCFGDDVFLSTLPYTHPAEVVVVGVEAVMVGMQ